MYCSVKLCTNCYLWYTYDFGYNTRDLTWVMIRVEESASASASVVVVVVVQ